MRALCGEKSFFSPLFTANLTLFFVKTSTRVEWFLWQSRILFSFPYIDSLLRDFQIYHEEQNLASACPKRSRLIRRGVFCSLQTAPCCGGEKHCCALLNEFTSKLMLVDSARRNSSLTYILVFYCFSYRKRDRILF